MNNSTPAKTADAPTGASMKHFRILAVVLLLVLALLPAEAQAQKGQEESEEYFEQWLDQTVAYIISEDERKVLLSLTSEAEKETFIEQFWRRRDPDPRTPANEFREEHFRRISYANERFGSGKPGWMTDRGRIYIIHGPPDEIESHPTGGYYRRGLRHGGGETAAYPFEIWRYRRIEGLGGDVELEFIDPTLSEQYRLALDPSEKDALLHAGGGATLLEELELADSRGRFTDHTRRGFYWADDNPFERYRIFSQSQVAPEVKYADLQGMVRADVRLAQLPVVARGDFFGLDDERVLAPVTVQIPNGKLTFELRNGVHVARVAVYGRVTSITNRLVAEFEDDLQLAYRPEQLEAGLSRNALYQKTVVLQSGVRHRLDLVVKDLQSGNIGVSAQPLAPPRFPAEELSMSSLLLSDSVRELSEIPTGNPMFVIGDVKVRPNLNLAFNAGSPLTAYFQLYGAALAQDTLSPDLHFRYRILDGDQLLSESSDDGSTSVRMSSSQRIVAVKPLPTPGLPPGEYTLEIEVQDRITGKSVQSRQPFHLQPPPDPQARQN